MSFLFRHNLRCYHKLVGTVLYCLIVNSPFQSLCVSAPHTQDVLQFPRCVPFVIVINQVQGLLRPEGESRAKGRDAYKLMLNVDAKKVMETDVCEVKSHMVI